MTSIAKVLFFYEAVERPKQPPLCHKFEYRATICNHMDQHNIILHVSRLVLDITDREHMHQKNTTTPSSLLWWAWQFKGGIPGEISVMSFSFHCDVIYSFSQSRPPTPIYLSIYLSIYSDNQKTLE